MRKPARSRAARSGAPGLTAIQAWSRASAGAAAAGPPTKRATAIGKAVNRMSASATGQAQQSDASWPKRGCAGNKDAKAADGTDLPRGAGALGSGQAPGGLAAARPRPDPG